jgi:hypothetical protein
MGGSMLIYLAAGALFMLGVYFLHMGFVTMASALDTSFVVLGSNIPNEFIGVVICVVGTVFLFLGVRAFFIEWQRSR